MPRRINTLFICKIVPINKKSRFFYIVSFSKRELFHFFLFFDELIGSILFLSQINEFEITPISSLADKKKVQLPILLIVPKNVYLHFDILEHMFDSLPYNLSRPML
jgi:hypothetical protein